MTFREGLFRAGDTEALLKFSHQICNTLCQIERVVLCSTAELGWLRPVATQAGTYITGGCAASVDQEVDSPMPVRSHIVGYDYPPDLTERHSEESPKG